MEDISESSNDRRFVRRIKRRKEEWRCGRSGGEAISRKRDGRVAEKQKKLDEVLKKDKVDEEEKQKAEAELSEAQATLKVPPSGEYVPEPVRICFPPIPEKYEVVPEFPAYKDSKPEDNPVVDISAGMRHNLAVSKSGHLYAWGYGNLAQLGLGSEEVAEVPSLVRSKLLRPYRSVTVSAGGQHCVALAVKKPDGEQN